MPFVPREGILTVVGVEVIFYYYYYYGGNNLSSFAKRLEEKSLGLLGKIVSSKDRCAGNSPLATYFQFTNSSCCGS